MTHTGMATMSRAPLALQLPALTPIGVSSIIDMSLPLGPDVLDAVQLVSSGRYAVTRPLQVRRSLLEARLTGRAYIEVTDSLVATMMDGVGFRISRCRIGSITRPDGSTRRPTEDGIRPCPLPGSTLAAMTSVISDSEIVDTDGRWYSAHMDGVQLWTGGNLRIERTKIEGWWQSAVMLKSDWGPISDVTISGCYLAGANYFQVRVIDGGWGRPRGVSVLDCVFERGTKGGACPMNTGDDLCSVASQTTYVRTEAERVDPTWVVFAGNLYPDGSEVIPPGGWLETL